MNEEEIARDVEVVDDDVDEGVDEFEVEDGPLAGDLVVLEGKVPAELPGRSRRPTAPRLRCGRSSDRESGPRRSEPSARRRGSGTARSERRRRRGASRDRQARWPSGSPLPRQVGWAKRSVPTHRCAARGHASLCPPYTSGATAVCARLGGGAAAVALGADAGEGKTRPRSGTCWRLRRRRSRRRRN